MTSFVRWWRFNLVGVIGAVAQLGSLAVLNRMMPRHYLAASAMALELTLLHNFAWHIRYTWRDRQDGALLPGQCLRFHLSNGMVSLVGNLTLMHILVGGSHLPVLTANAIAILVCSLINFCLAEVWVFSAKRLQLNAS